MVERLRRRAVLCPRYGCAISRATPIGDTAPSARTIRAIACPSSRSAAGPTPIQRRTAPARRPEVPAQRADRPVGALYPQDGTPGPAIGFLQEALRWWDHWLKGWDTGIMARAECCAPLIEDWRPPGDRLSRAPRPLVGEAAWPSPRIDRRALPSAPRRSARRVRGRRRGRHSARPADGPAVGEWMGTGVPGEGPADQRLDDGFLAVFDSAPLTRAHGDPRRARDRDRDRLRQAGRAALRAALRRRARTARRAGFPTACSISRIATATPSRARWSPARSTRSASSSTIAATPSRPAMSCASRSPAPIGR